MAPVQYSTLALLPDEGMGLFVIYNGDRARPLTVEGQTVAAFMDRFYPAPASAALVPTAEFPKRAEQFTGEYQRNNFGGSYTTFEKLARLLGNSNRHITNPGDGTLEVGLLAGSTRFVETAPGFFGEQDGQDKPVFRRSAQGQVTSAAFGGVPEYTYERLSWTETPTFNLLLLAACASVIGSTVLAAAITWIRDRVHRTATPHGRLASAARWSPGGGGGPESRVSRWLGCRRRFKENPGFLVKRDPGVWWRAARVRVKSCAGSVALVRTALPPSMVLRAWWFCPRSGWFRDNPVRARWRTRQPSARRRHQRPTRPVERGAFSVADATQFAVSNTYAYVVRDSNFGAVAHMNVYDVGNPANVIPVGSGLEIPRIASPYPVGGIVSLIVSGNYIYASGLGGLHVLDISDPAQPNELATCGNDQLGQIALADKTLIGFSDFGTISAINVSDPGHPVGAASVAGSDRNGSSGLAVSDDHVYVSGSTGMRVFSVDHDIEDPFTAPSALGGGNSRRSFLN